MARRRAYSRHRLKSAAWERAYRASMSRRGVIVIGALVLVGTRLARQPGRQPRAADLALPRSRGGGVGADAGRLRRPPRRHPRRRGRYGAATVSAPALDQAVAEGRLAYAVLLDQSGEVISRVADAHVETRARECCRRRRVTSALAGAPVSLSDVSAVVGPIGCRRDRPRSCPSTRRTGRRVLVSGAPAALFSTFLRSYLAACAHPRRHGVRGRRPRASSWAPAPRAPAPRATEPVAEARAADRPCASGSIGRSDTTATSSPSRCRKQLAGRAHVQNRRCSTRSPAHASGCPGSSTSPWASSDLGSSRCCTGFDPCGDVGGQRGCEPSTPPGEQEHAAATGRRAGALQRRARAVRLDRLARPAGAAAQGPDVQRPSCAATRGRPPLDEGHDYLVPR